MGDGMNRTKPNKTVINCAVFHLGAFCGLHKATSFILARTEAQTEVQPVNICSEALLGPPTRRSDNDKYFVSVCKKAVLANNVRMYKYFHIKQTKQ